jgi:hypothetical protein
VVASGEHWDTWQEACKTHADCRELGDGLYCTEQRWDITRDGSAHAIGSACYEWGTNVCSQGASSPSWAELNTNFENMGEFSYFSQLWCVDDSSTGYPLLGAEADGGSHDGLYQVSSQALEGVDSPFKVYELGTETEEDEEME